LCPGSARHFSCCYKGYQTKEIAGVLGISVAYAQRLAMGIRIKAARLWELQETRVDPSLATYACLERNKDKYNANRRAKRKEVNKDGPVLSALRRTLGHGPRQL